MNLNAVSIGKNPPHDVNVVIEVPIGGEPIKYEMDKESGALQVDRFLYTSMRYPGNYGFIPHTLSDDGDPCDVIVANTRAIVPGAVMSCRVVGVLIMEDEAGGDEKLLAVPSAKLTQRYAHVQNYADLPSITLQQIEHFFAHYKDLEPNKWVKIVRWGDAEEARGPRARGHRAGEEGEGRGQGRELSWTLNEIARASRRRRMRRAETRTGAGLRPMKRSFIDARIDRMLEFVRAPRRRAAALRAMGAGRLPRQPGRRKTDRRTRHGLERGRIQARPVRARGPDLVHAADGRLARARRRSGPPLCREGDRLPRTASARLITIMWSRPRTS